MIKENAKKNDKFLQSWSKPKLNLLSKNPQKSI